MKTEKIIHASDLMFAIAKRAGELSMLTMPHLRFSIATADTFYGAMAETKHKNRAECIEEILIEEFEEVAKKVDDDE